MEKDTSPLKSKPRCKAISPLFISGGFVHGWAFDPLRSELEVNLKVDGTEAGSGWTGHPVADEFYAQYTPPSTHCGFILALPSAAMDGFVHQISIKVAEWRSMPLAPEINEEWCHGTIFGEVKFTPQGFAEGWVGFRSAIDVNQLPPVAVSQDDQIQYAIQLTRISPASINNCQLMGQFRAPKSQFTLLRDPVFSCLGIKLRLQHTASIFKPIGQIESIDHETIDGWVLNSANPSESVDLQLMVDGLPFRAIRPNVRRDNLAEYLNLLPEEIGMAGFKIDLPAKLKDGQPHTVAIHFRKNGMLLNDKPLSYQHRPEGLNLQQAWAMLGKPIDGTNENRAITKSHTSRRKKPAPQVSVIILNRNGAPCLEALFESWLRYNTTPVELIVIDHASSDASLDILKHWENKLPIQTLALDKNDSFSASSNRGAKLAKAPFVLFLNNDIVWRQDALPCMLETLKDKKTGVVGLKLLKTEFTENSENVLFNNSIETVVQHLGVRYILTGDQYWPYETSPDSSLPEELYSPQDVPIVTGAVMLCRREEFLELGGFDEGYFYGYEDVEFCLRMTFQQNKRIICRNDLVALHHHGYTRLTGRELSMIDHQQDNQRRLSEHYGLWTKRTFWQSLLDVDNLLTNEVLTIGFAIHNFYSNKEGKDQLAIAVELAERICAKYPNVKTFFLTPETNWDMVDGLHVVVALSPYYDVRSLKHARPDLRTAGYIINDNELDSWSTNPSLELYDVFLCLNQPLVTQAEKLMPKIVKPIPVSQKKPLADLLDANRLRVMLRISSNPNLLQAAKLLAQALKNQGVLVYITGSGGWRDQARVVEVYINLHGEPVKDLRKPKSYNRRDDAINVLWIVEDIDSLRSKDLAQADQVWLAVPTLKFPEHLTKAAQELRSVELDPESMEGLAQHLQNAVEKKIERTFCTS